MTNERDEPVLYAAELEFLENKYSALQEVESQLEIGEFGDQKQKTDAIYKRVVLKREVTSIAENPTVVERVQSMAQYITSQVVSLEKRANNLPASKERTKEEYLKRSNMFRQRLGSVALYYQRFGHNVEAPKDLVEKVYELAITKEEAILHAETHKAELGVRFTDSTVVIDGQPVVYAPNKGVNNRQRARQRKAAIEHMLSEEAGETEYSSRELWQVIEPHKQYEQKDVQALRQWLKAILVNDKPLIVSNNKLGKDSRIMLNPLFTVKHEIVEEEDELIEPIEEVSESEIRLTNNIYDYVPELYVLASQMDHYDELFEYFGKPKVGHRLIQDLADRLEEIQFKTEDELEAYRKYSFAKVDALLKNRDIYYDLISTTDLDHPGIEMLAVLAPHFATNQDKEFLAQALGSTRRSKEEYSHGTTVKVLEFVDEAGSVLLAIQSNRKV